MTTFQPSIESLARMDCLCAAWEERLELADYRKIHGTAMSPKTTAKTPSWELGRKTKEQYKLHLEGKASYMTFSVSRH
jgi:hypothetical protein